MLTRELGALASLDVDPERTGQGRREGLRHPRLLVKRLAVGRNCLRGHKVEEGDDAGDGRDELVGSELCGGADDKDGAC